MAKIYDLGSVMPIFKGDWVSGNEYETNNFVRHNDITWVCTIPLNTTTTLEPSEANSTAWKVLVKSLTLVSSVNGQGGEVKLPIATTKDPTKYVETLVDGDNNKYIFASTDCVDDKIADATTILQNYTDTAITNLLADFSLDLGKIFN